MEMDEVMTLQNVSPWHELVSGTGSDCESAHRPGQEFLCKGGVLVVPGTWLSPDYDSRRQSGERKGGE